MKINVCSKDKMKMEMENKEGIQSDAHDVMDLEN